MDIKEVINIFEVIYLNYGPPIVFLSSFIEISPFGWLLPGGLMLAIGGFFAFGKTIYLIAILIFGWFGAWLTFVLAYYFGALTGYSMIRYFKQEKNAKVAESLLNKHGPVILTTSMLASLTRFWVAYIAGVQKYNFWKFFFYSGIASLTWSALMTIVGYIAGAERENLESGLARLGVITWVLFFIAIGVIAWKVKQTFKEDTDSKS